MELLRDRLLLRENVSDDEVSDWLLQGDPNGDISLAIDGNGVDSVVLMVPRLLLVL